MTPKTCPDCGYSVSGNSVSCPHCELFAFQKQRDQYYERKLAEAKLFAAWAWLFIAVLAGAGLFFAIFISFFVEK